MSEFNPFIFKTTRIIKSVPVCPTCSAILDAATSLGGNWDPKPGNITACVYCLTILQFNYDLTVQLATDVVIEAFKQEDPEHYNLFMKAIEATKKIKPPPVRFYNRF